jgi:hypothetical protein
MTRAINQSSMTAAGIAAAIALAGCGGGGSSGLSKPQLAAKANAACSAYTSAAGRITPPSDFTTNPVAAAAYLDKLRPLVTAQAHTLLGLKPAASAKPLWDQFTAGVKRLDALFYSADAKAHAKDRSGLSDLAQLATYKQSTLNPIANRLGASDCAK